MFHGGQNEDGEPDPDHEQRKLGGSFAYGALVVVGFSAVNIDLGWTRILARESTPGTDVDLVTGILCGGAGYFGVCLDGRAYFGDVRTGRGDETTRSIFLGMTLGAFAR